MSGGGHPPLHPLEPDELPRGYRPRHHLDQGGPAGDGGRLPAGRPGHQDDRRILRRGRPGHAAQRAAGGQALLRRGRAQAPLTPWHGHSKLVWRPKLNAEPMLG